MLFSTAASPDLSTSLCPAGLTPHADTRSVKSRTYTITGERSGFRGMFGQPKHAASHQVVRLRHSSRIRSIYSENCPGVMEPLGHRHPFVAEQLRHPQLISSKVLVDGLLVPHALRRMVGIFYAARELSPQFRSAAPPGGRYLCISEPAGGDL
jgi:hypothetical protein